MIEVSRHLGINPIHVETINSTVKDGKEHVRIRMASGEIHELPLEDTNFYAVSTLRRACHILNFMYENPNDAPLPEEDIDPEGDEFTLQLSPEPNLPLDL